MITTRAIKWWHCQSRAVFWYCVSCISFPLWNPRRFFFLFEHLGVQRLKYSRCLRKVGKESNLLLPSESCASFLCADPKWFLGLSPIPFPWQAEEIMLLFSKIMGQGSLAGSNSGNPCSHIVNVFWNYIAKYSLKEKTVQRTGMVHPVASHPCPKTFIIVPGALQPQTTESWSLVMLRSLFLTFLWNMGSISQAREFCCNPWGLLPWPEASGSLGDLCLKPSAPWNISFCMLCIVMLHVTLCIALIHVLYQRAPSHLLSWMGAEWFKSKHLTLNLSWAGLQASSFWSKTEAYQGPGIKAE